MVLRNSDRASDMEASPTELTDGDRAKADGDKQSAKRLTAKRPDRLADRLAEPLAEWPAELFAPVGSLSSPSP